MMKNMTLALAAYVCLFPRFALAETLYTSANEQFGISEINAGPLFNTNVKYSKMMFDKQNFVTDKALQQLLLKQNGVLQDHNFYFGARLLGSYMYERTNTPGKFPILSRLPPTHTSGNHDTYSVVNDISAHMTLAVPYLLFYGQGEYTEVQYPGQKPTQLRKAFVTIGDLDKFPAYLTIGRKSVNFGDMSSYTPITHSHSSHYFWAQNNNDSLIELGYYKDNTHLSATLIPNDRGKRVVDSPKNDGRYRNFALNGYHVFDIGETSKLKVGAGFIRGTIYNSSLAHHPPSTGLNDKFWASAWNINSTLSYGDYDVMAEFTRTVDDWPATDAKVHALTVQARKNDVLLDVPVTYSVMLSQGVQGHSGDEWREMTQAAVGFEANITPNISVGFEYLNNSGFVPLILPKITADDGVVSHTVISGLKITF